MINHSVYYLQSFGSQQVAQVLLGCKVWKVENLDLEVVQVWVRLESTFINHRLWHLEQVRLRHHVSLLSVQMATLVDSDRSLVQAFLMLSMDLLDYFGQGSHINRVFLLI